MYLFKPFFIYLICSLGLFACQNADQQSTHNPSLASATKTIETLCRAFNEKDLTIYMSTFSLEAQDQALTEKKAQKAMQADPPISYRITALETVEEDQERVRMRASLRVFHGRKHVSDEAIVFTLTYQSSAKNWLITHSESFQ